MRIFLCALSGAWLSISTVRANPCADNGQNHCVAKNSSDPAKGKSCGAVQLERAGNPASAYSSKGGIRLH